MTDKERLAAEFKAAQEAEHAAREAMGEAKSRAYTAACAYWGVPEGTIWLVRKIKDGRHFVAGRLNYPGIKDRPSLDGFAIRKDGKPYERGQWIGSDWEVIGPYTAEAAQ